MRIKYLVYIVLFALFVSCEEAEPIAKEFVPIGQLNIGEQSNKLSQVRFEAFIDTVHAKRPTYRIQFSQPTISLTESALSGYGYVLELQIPMASIPVSKTITLEDKTYSVGADLGNIIGAQSQLVYYPNKKLDEKDTLRQSIQSGTLTLKRNVEIPSFSFDFKTPNKTPIQGSFQGKPKHRQIINGDSIGYSQEAGEAAIALQSGELLEWGDLFNTGLNYYEFQVYSTTMRRRDNGTLQEAMVWNFGILSKSSKGVPTGDYALVKTASQEGLFHGHLINRAPWGTYFQKIENGSIKLRSTIWKGDLHVEQSGDQYQLNFTGTDQQMKVVNVTLKAPFKVEKYTQLTQKTE
jgi:hypothetical protein